MMGELARRMHRGPRRAVWSNGKRVHVAVHEVDEDDHEAFASRLSERLEALEGVRWARYNGFLGRVIVERDPALASLEAIIDGIESVEEELSAGTGYASPLPTYPGDVEIEHRKWFELAADAASMAVSLGLRFSASKETPHDIDFAALTATLDGIPRVRKSVERSVSQRAADLTFELMKTLSMIVVRSETGPLSAVFGHALSLRESRARRETWAARESELCAAREHHPHRIGGRKPRPTPLRRGPIERYEEGAIPVSLGAFGAGLVFTRDTEGSATSLFAGLPRAARHGRTSFAAHFGWILARRGVLVFENEGLGRLDRIDTVAMTVELARRDPTGAQRIARRARELDLALRVIGDEVETIDWLPPEARAGAKRPRKAVRRLQRTGAGVLLIASGPCDGFRAADLGIALSNDPPPWGAQLVARHGVEDALLLLDAIATARRVAIESVMITMAEAATGFAIALAGLERQTTKRVMTVANAAALIAMINGVRLAHGLATPPPAAPADTTPYHAMPPDEVLEMLGSAPDGLTMQDAEARRVKPPPPRSSVHSFGRALVEELASPLTPILGAGAGLSAAVGSVVDAGLIVSALSINGLVGATQRFGARKAIDELETREERAVRTLRDGVPLQIAADALVRGDVIELGAGELVPADCRLIEAQGVEVDESSLTGESLPVTKDVRAVDSEVVAERSSMIYEGTSFSAGHARAVVVAIGKDTEVGRARSMPDRQTQAGGVEARLEELTAITGPVAGLSALGIMGSGLLRGRPFPEVVTSAVGLGVAAVPEGLPILSTLAQLAAARRLTRRGALVKNPRSLEALGRVDVLCADKTGTLTEGTIRLAIVSDGHRVAPVTNADPELRRVLAVARRASPERDGSKLPHPTDEALVRGAEEVGVSTSIDGHTYERGPELPFEPGRGFHASIGAEDGARVLSVKGAPETILPRCARTREGKLRRRQQKRLLKEARTIGRQGYRVLAVAERAVPRSAEPCDDEVCDLVFLGFVGLADPVRASAREALRALDEAGVRVLMLTGDHPSTAEAIAEQLDLASAEVVTGAEIDALDDDTLGERLEQASIFARVTPAQKVRLVRVLAARGRTVAMTGDGANDAAAIALAHVGIAVGAHATGAARSVADLVVTDGRIETIVDAILEGRALWASVRDAVSILVGGNFGEIAFALIPGLITGQAPLNARQLLLVNLVTDTLPSLAIAVAPPQLEDVERLLREGPEASLGERLDRDLVTRAVITSSAAGAAYAMSRMTGAGPARAGTVGLMALTGAQLGQTLISGGRDLGVLAAAVGSLAALLAVVEIPGVSHFFGCRPLGPIALTQALGTTAIATGIAWALPRWLEGRVPREPRRAMPAPDDEGAIITLGQDEDDPLFGGLFEAA